jgi:transcription antitermination factor NusG
MLDAAARPWFVVAVEPQAERAVAARTEDLDGIEAYYPTGQRLVRSRARQRLWEVVDKPAMPGYVFVRGGRFDQFQRQLDTPESVPHCCGFLGADGPQPISDQIVSDLRDRQARGDFDSQLRSGRYWAPRWVRGGTRARITGGPLKGHAGEIWRMTRRGFVSIWVTIMGRPSLAEVPLDWVARVR